MLAHVDVHPDVPSVKKVVPVSCIEGSPQEAIVLFMTDGFACPGASVWPMTTSPVVFVCCCEPPGVGAGDLASESFEAFEGNKNYFKNTQRVPRSDVIIAAEENT